MAFHLVLSPHPDDGPLTMGATMHHLAKRGDRMLMITMMGGNMVGSPPDTPVVRKFHSTWNVGDNPVELRRDEDRDLLYRCRFAIGYLTDLSHSDKAGLIPTRKSIFDTSSRSSGD